LLYLRRKQEEGEEREKKRRREGKKEMEKNSKHGNFEKIKDNL
jgi:hypothetical protein